MILVDMNQITIGAIMAESKGNENLMGAATYLLGFITGIVFLLVEKPLAE
jgi:hypothetical protein